MLAELPTPSLIAGTAISSTSSVMAIAKTPSLNASRRFFLCLIFAGFFRLGHH